MRERGDTTRFGFPPAGETWLKLPEAVPWDTPVSEIAGYWLEVTCQCGRTSHLPLRLVAAERGWGKTLREIVPGLSCSGLASGQRCGKRPAKVLLVAETYSGGRDKQRPQLQLVP